MKSYAAANQETSKWHNSTRKLEFQILTFFKMLKNLFVQNILNVVNALYPQLFSTEGTSDKGWPTVIIRIIPGS